VGRSCGNTRSGKAAGRADSFGSATDGTYAYFANVDTHANNTLRVRNQPGLAARIEAVTSEQPRAHWLALLEANDIPCGPINNDAQVFADPHLVAREMAVDVDHATLGRVRSLGSAIKMRATPTDPRRRAPLLGEHTQEVLAENGFTAGEISSLRAAGAIG
jgi:crotonobetainyl-CoA:carnitine CoA-transferase CaiB-like acyl-CoA transferase